MDKNKIIEMINSKPACHLATVESGKPKVRGMLIYSADESGIVFHTGTFKDLHKQLQAEPHVEFCFNDFDLNVQVRVSGTAGIVDDIELKKQIVSDRPFLQPFVDSQGYDELAVYRAKEMIATVWTMESNFDEKEYIKLN